MYRIRAVLVFQLHNAKLTAESANSNAHYIILNTSTIPTLNSCRALRKCDSLWRENCGAKAMFASQILHFLSYILYKSFNVTLCYDAYCLTRACFKKNSSLHI